MPIQTVTWGEVDLGNIVRDKSDRLWTVTDRKDSWLLLERGEQSTTLQVTSLDGHLVRRRRPDEPVDIYVPTEAEALNLLHHVLHARVLRMIEEREHSIAATWIVEPVARKATEIRDHIDWLHGFNVDDVWRRWKGTDANPSDTAKKKASLAELVEAHDDAHAHPDVFPMTYPHRHDLTPKESP